MIKIDKIVISLFLLALTVSFSIEENIEKISNLKTPQLQSQYVPISKRYPGILVGPQNGSITIELVYDPVCDDSAALDVVFRQFLTNLDKDTRAQINVRFLINALPYHILAFKQATAIRYVNDQLGGQTAMDVFRYFLQNLADWGQKSPTVINNSINTVMNNIAGIVSTLTGLPKDDIRKQLAHYSATEGKTRQMIKYTMGSLRTPGTPQMFINGARLDGATAMTAQQLGDLIKKLL